MTYTTPDYAAMISDSVRLEAFTSALQRAIEPGVTTVLDIGTGTGVMAFVAAHAGAKRVYALEPNPAIEVAREIVRLNGLGDRIELHKTLSTDIELPPCDVVISDLRGRSPFYEGHIPSIVDARQRLLKPGGQLIARRDVIYMVPVEAPKVWDEYVGAWDHIEAAGVDMTPAKRLTANSVFGLNRKPEHLLAEPVRFAEIDYTTVESSSLKASAQATFTRDGTFHGLSMWFDIELDDQTTLRNGIGEPELVYGRPYMPVLEPFEVRAGEVLDFEARFQLVQSTYVWSWSGGVRGDATRSFSQTTFEGTDIAPEDFAGFRLDATPRTSPRGAMVAHVLVAMNGETSIAALARDLRASFPDVGDEGEAVGFVSQVVASYASAK